MLLFSQVYLFNHPIQPASGQIDWGGAQNELSLGDNPIKLHREPMSIDIPLKSFRRACLTRFSRFDDQRQLYFPLDDN